MSTKKFINYNEITDFTKITASMDFCGEKRVLFPFLQGKESKEPMHKIDEFKNEIIIHNKVNTN